MPSISSISLSGMNAAQTALSAAAFNVANLGTDGFRRQQVTQATVAPAGVSTATGRATEPGADMLGDVVGMLQSKNSFLANLTVFKASDRMTGSLLDAVG